MTSKRLLEQLYIASKIGTTSKENEKVLKDYFKAILKDLDRLEKLEKDFEELKELNQFNYKSVKCEEHNYKLLENEYIKLEKENQKLKERYKHRAETSNDLCKEVRQYEKAFEILNDKFELFIFEVDNIHYIGNEYAVGQLSQEQYELLIERGVRKC